jgi:hypothetical protein
MPRALTIYLPPNDFEWNRQALQSLADTIITEPGQRGATLSKLIEMIASAYVRDISATEALMRQIKAVAEGH